MNKCPHCAKKKKELEMVEVRVAGNILNVTVCTKCKENLEKIMNFATVFPVSSGVKAQKPKEYKKPAKVKADPKFEKFALSKEEIAETQALRPAVRMEDTPMKRAMDDLDSVRARKRVRLYGMGAGRLAQARNERLMQKARVELGTANVKCIKDDGLEAVFEAA